MNIELPSADIINQQFAKDILDGLKSSSKSIPSKYFYDEEGSKLFQTIMELDEYYLTDCEYEIFTVHKEYICTYFQERGPFDLIELGAGDGLKTRILLEELLRQGADFRYSPVDISGDAMDGLVKNLREELPQLQIQPQIGDYFQALKKMNHESETPKIVLFLGSNIGNFNREAAHYFLTQLHQNLRKGDALLMGVDLKKDPEKIMAAYDDRLGITKAFNMNLLKRMNRELGADFNPAFFRHYPNYDPISGEVRSYLISTKEQTVSFSKLDTSISFGKWEPIHTEISQKYSLKEIAELALISGFQLKENLLDCKHYFTDSIWEV